MASVQISHNSRFVLSVLFDKSIIAHFVLFVKGFLKFFQKFFRWRCCGTVFYRIAISVGTPSHRPLTDNSIPQSTAECNRQVAQTSLIFGRILCAICHLTAAGKNGIIVFWRENRPGRQSAAGPGLCIIIQRKCIIMQKVKAL